MTLSDKIVQLRKQKGWSQEELAERIGVSRQAVSKWESAQAAPDIDKILLLSELFGVSTDYLLKDSNMANGLQFIGSVIRSVVSSGFAFFNLLSLLLITPVVAFYMLRDWDKFIAKVDSLLPRKSRESVREQAREIDRTLAGFIRGQLSVCLILGTYYSTGLYLVGLELGVVVGFVAGIISFIPYIGSISGFVVSLAIAFAQFNSWTPILQVVAVFLSGQFIEGNFLTPKLVGDNVGLHPVWVMFALLAGGVLLGFLGLMIAVPVAAIIGVLVRHAIDNYKNSNLYLE